MKPKVVITSAVFPEIVEMLREHCEVVTNPTRRRLPREVIMGRCGDADAARQRYEAAISAPTPSRSSL